MLFILDPDPDFLLIPDPRSWGQKGTGSRMRLCNIGFGLLTCGDGGDILAVELVTAVHAVRRSITLPRAEHAVTARTPELPVLTKKAGLLPTLDKIFRPSQLKNAARKKTFLIGFFRVTKVN